MVYEPALKQESFFNSRVIRDLDEFKRISDIIIANRYNDDIMDVLDKVYSRDLFQDNKRAAGNRQSCFRFYSKSEAEAGLPIRR